MAAHNMTNPLMEECLRRFRAGELSNDETLLFFQLMERRGMLFRMPQDIQQLAARLIIAGLIECAEDVPIPGNILARL